MYNYDFFEADTILRNINKFLPNIEKKWIYTNNCQSCNSIFGSIINRQHHCRCCGRCYCWDCCHNNISIPKDIITISKEENNYKNQIINYIGKEKGDKNKKVVCNNCHSKLLILNKIKLYINFLSFCDFDTLHKTLTVSKNFYYASIYWLFKYKNIQYKSDNYNKWEINMLFNNIKYFSEHNNWIKSIINAYIFEIYNYNNSSLDIEKTLNYIFAEKTKECKNIYCSITCGKQLNIYDLFEIIENIVQQENNIKNMFWNSVQLKINFKTIINNIHWSNNTCILNLLTPFAILLTKFFNAENIDIDIAFKLFDILLLDSKKISQIINDVDNLDLKSFYFTKLLEQYVVKKKIILDENLVKFKKVRDFCINIYYNSTKEIKEINIPYIFDFDADIIEIIKIENKIDYISLIIKIKFSVNSKEEIKNFLLKKISNCDEIYCNILIKNLYEKYYFYFIKKQILIPTIFIPNYKLVSPNYIAIELNNKEDISINQLIMEKKSVNDYIYMNNTNRTVEKMILNYSFSLSFICFLCYAFNININNLKNIFIDENGKLYLTQYDFNKEENNNIFVLKNLCNILGTKGGNYYGEFEKKTIELVNIIKLYQGFIKSYTQIIKYNRIKNITKSQNDIRII